MNILIQVAIFLLGFALALYLYDIYDRKHTNVEDMQ